MPKIAPEQPTPAADHHQPSTPIAQHGSGPPALSAQAAAFVLRPPPGTTSSAAAADGPAVAPGHGRPGGRGRGRGGSLSRELLSGGGPKPHQAPGRGGGGGGGGSGGSRGAGEARPRQQAGEGVLGSSPGRRGVAANHLLGFQPSRREADRQGGSGGRGGGRGGRGGGRAGPPRRPAPKPQPFDRNKFLQANFRFLVSDAVDARRFEADPDRMLEWEDVVQVELLSAAPVRCPITLDDRPFCPQITPCGHVFSFPAIVGHLVSHGGPEMRKSAPCPLCYTQIAARELRPVQVHRVVAPAVGQRTTFQLLRRQRDSINPEVAAGGQPAAASMGSLGKGSAQAGGAGQHAWLGRGAPAAPAVPAAPAEGWGAAAGGTACNRFSKFTLVAEAAAAELCVAEARRLAAYAAQLTAEGGLEAAFEAPNVFSAIDALAARARAAAERRQRLLLDAADPMAQEALLSPEEVGQQAARAVKSATTAALSAAAVQREQRAAAAAREQQYPSLAASVPAPAPPRRPAVLAPAGPSAPLQPAFSDDEGQGEEGSNSGSRASPAHGQPRTAAVPISASPGGLVLGGATASAAAAAAPSSGGGAGELSSSARSTGGMLGSSPAETGGGGPGGSEYFFYQAADGQWLFISPLNLRMLLAHHGSYAACPATLSAPVLEVEDVAQDEASRRRMRVLAHLPLTATFKLCEVDLSGLLPAEALAPFADELAQRERKRVQRAKQDARRLRQERAAAAAAAAAAANLGLSAAELRAMPLPSASLLPAGLQHGAAEGAVAEAAGVEEQAGSPTPTPPQPGVSYAALARDGFAATGPSLLSSQGAASPAPSAGAPAAVLLGAPQGAWGPKPVVPPALPAWGAPATTDDVGSAARQLGGLQVGGGGKGGKKKVVLFSQGGQRKY